MTAQKQCCAGRPLGLRSLTPFNPISILESEAPSIAFRRQQQTVDSLLTGKGNVVVSWRVHLQMTLGQYGKSRRTVTFANAVPVAEAVDTC
jgi:hypothetical protein